MIQHNNNNQSSGSAEEESSPQSRFTKEMAEISFQELQKFFAKGQLILVNENLNLVEVAVEIHLDNTAQIQTWLDTDKLVRAHDEHAKKWVAERSVFMAVTVAPWVLVQELNSKENQRLNNG